MNKQEKQSMWKIQLSTASLVLIPTAVAINYVGKTIAAALKLPLWLDALGTVLASMLGGPIVGALSGAINNIIYGFTQSPISFVYALTQIGIGIAVGVFAKKGKINTFGKAIMIGLAVGMLAVVISTPLNIIFWGGQTGNLWGDATFAVFIAKGSPLWLASLLDEIVVDIPDKIATLVICFLMYKGLPKRLISMYEEQEIEEFD